MQEYQETVDADIEKMRRIISLNIKHYRKNRRLSQLELGEYCGLHRTYISDLENAKCNPTLSVMMTLAATLHISLQQLLQE